MEKVEYTENENTVTQNETEKIVPNEYVIVQFIRGILAESNGEVDLAKLLSKFVIKRNEKITEFEAKELIKEFENVTNDKNYAQRNSFFEKIKRMFNE